MVACNLFYSSCNLPCQFGILVVSLLDNEVDHQEIKYY